MRILYRLYCFFGFLSSFFRRRVTWAAAFLGGTTIVAMISGLDTRHSILFRIYSILLILLLFGFLGGLVSRRGRLRVDRILPRHGTVGVELPYRVTITNLGGRLSGFVLREWPQATFPNRDDFLNLREPMEEKRNLFDRVFVYYRWMWLTERARRARFEESTTLSLAKGKSAEAWMKLMPLKRGPLVLEKMRSLRLERLGLFKATRVVASKTQTLTILPKRYRLPELLIPGQNTFESEGEFSLATAGSSEEFLGLRDYQPGDPPRHLHWKSWAKTGQPMVKVYEDQTAPRFAVFLDVRQKETSDESFEEAISIAASFADPEAATPSGLSVLLAGGRVLQPAHTSNKEEESLYFLDQLARVSPDNDLDHLEKTAELLAPHLGSIGGCALILLHWEEAHRHALATLRGMGLDCRVLVVAEPGRTAEEAHLDKISVINPRNTWKDLLNLDWN
ncbi:MAG: DUF58 domain-containing protein [Verrucomicrobiota bacterium]